jgi:hypothetical protein
MSPSEIGVEGRLSTAIRNQNSGDVLSEHAHHQRMNISRYDRNKKSKHEVTILKCFQKLRPLLSSMETIISRIFLTKLRVK